MTRTSKGEISPNEDGTYSVTITEGGNFDEEGYLNGSYFKLIEIDGRLYCDESVSNNKLYGYWDSAKIVSQSDDEIIFDYIRDDLATLHHITGRLVNENGWKYSWIHQDWLF